MHVQHFLLRWVYNVPECFSFNRMMIIVHVLVISLGHYFFTY